MASADQAIAAPARRAKAPTWRLRAGPANSVPIILFLLIGFAAPLLAVIGYSFMPPRTFGLWQTPTLLNYETVFNSTSYISFLWSLGLAALTVLLLALICYPVALGLARVLGSW
jgi:spermidine/putrescine transport system permease protein